MKNPYQAPAATVADPHPISVPRPWSVTLALVILWFVLSMWTLGSIRQLRALDSVHDAGSLGYAAYMIGMIAAPAWLLVMIARARNWARVAAFMLQGLDLLWRLYLLIVIEGSPQSGMKNFLVPASVQLVAFVLMFVPRSNAWFRSGREVS